MGSLRLAAADALTAGTLIDGARMYAASADAINMRIRCTNRVSSPRGEGRTIAA